MNYRNTEMKLDQIVSYFNDEKINLSPAFQRGHVWSVGTRRKLMANIVQGRPIPAVFLYKQASGSRYSYNILDGKQRLESLILFIGSRHADFRVMNWASYFFADKLKKQVDFWIQLPSGKKSFAELDEDVIRDLREYAIPTVEIQLNDDSHLDEIINLFVDINQQGVPVGRFDIVKAMGANNRLLKSVFNLLALKQKRQQDEFYRSKSNDFTFVLKTLNSINSVSDGKSQVDRMWERLLEIVLFWQTRRHRKPVDILKSFISVSRPFKSARRTEPEDRARALTVQEQRAIRRHFEFLAKAYRTTKLRETSLATDQTHFYTMVTSMIATNQLDGIDESELAAKLAEMGRVVDEPQLAPTSKRGALRRYILLSSDRTTDTPRREERQTKFIEVLRAL